MKQELAQEILQRNKDNYEEMAREFSHTRAYCWPEMKLLIQCVKEGDRVLDLGCGNGRLYELLKEKKVEYIGLDQCEMLIEIAKRKFQINSKPRFVAGSALSLPFENEKFDAVFAITLLHHIPSALFRRRVLEECRRVLRPGGSLILTCWNLRQSKLLVKYRIWPMIFGWRPRTLDWRDVFIPWKAKKETIYRYYHVFTLRELKNTIKKVGFQIISSDRGRNLAIIGQKR